MHRLNTLGILELDGPPPPDGSILAQPKRAALLLYLALARPPAWQRRDRLLALLWPDLDESHARNALSQALHHLRRGLGPDTLPGRGVELVQVDPDRLTTDARRFQELVREGRLPEALSLYSGDLAPGFHAADAPDFEEWLAGERRYLRDLAFQAARSLARTREEGGDFAGAIAALKRATALEPSDEPAARRLMQLLHQRGELVDALRIYSSLCEQLRRELDVEPSPETRALAEGLRAPELKSGGRGLEAANPLASLPQTGAIARPAAGTVAPRVGWTRWRNAALVTAGLVAVLVGGLWAFRSQRDHSRAASRSVAVLPFRVGGADSSLIYLGEGLVDLLAVKLSGQSGPQPVDPGAIISAWRQVGGPAQGDLTLEDGMHLALRLNAGQVLLGAVTGTPARLTLSASITGVQDGKELARADATGPMDSLSGMIDRLAAALLVARSGEPLQRLGQLTSQSLPALQAYLAGRAAYRGGAYHEAVARYRLATDLDSTFALAWLRLVEAADWVDGSTITTARARAAALRQRLNQRDRAYLMALLGQFGFGTEPLASQLDAWALVVELSPDLAEGWYGLGDLLFHFGRALEQDSGFTRAREAFDRALALDSGYTAPLAHLVHIAVLDGPDGEIRRLAGLYFARDSTGDVAEFLRWRIAQALGDSAELGRLRARWGDLPRTALTRIATWSQLDGVGLADGDRAMAQLEATSVKPDELTGTINLLSLTTANRGHFVERHRVLALSDRLRGAPHDSVRFWLSEGLFAGGGRELMSRAVVLLQQRAGHGDSVAGLELLVWRLWATDLQDSSRLSADLGLLDRARDLGMDASTELALVALRATVLSRSDAAAAVQRLAAEAERRAGSSLGAFLNLALARCYERQGRPGAALHAVQRRAYDQWSGLPMLAPSLREEGRLALVTGDTSAAVRAWRHYLILRADADSSVLADRAEVARQLVILQRH